MTQSERQPSPLIATLARIVRAVDEREQAAAAARRRTIMVVRGGKEGRAA